MRMRSPPPAAFPAKATEAPGSRGLAILLAALLAALPACRGRSDFRRGESLYQAGDYRQAYYHFWRAYQQSPGAAHFASLRRAGRRVAQAERERGRAAEGRGDLEGALAAYDLALEYDPGWAEIEAD